MDNDAPRFTNVAPAHQRSRIGARGWPTSTPSPTTLSAELRRPESFRLVYMYNLICIFARTFMYYGISTVHVYYINVPGTSMHVVIRRCTFPRTPETRYYWITFLIHPHYGYEAVAAQAASTRIHTHAPTTPRSFLVSSIPLDGHPPPWVLRNALRLSIYKELSTPSNLPVVSAPARPPPTASHPPLSYSG